MDLHFFEQQWKNSKSLPLDEEQSFWDLRADEFNSVTLRKDKSDRRATLAFIREYGALGPYSRVLDIGCGTGRFSLEFAPLSESVLGLDISPAMLKLARENAEQEGLANVEFMHSPWQTLDLEARGLRKYFDLVFAFRTPGIDSPAALYKMMEASHGYCFLSGFASRKDSVNRLLRERLFPGCPEENLETGMHAACNILWMQGIYPDVTFRKSGWVKDVPIERAVKTYPVRLRHLAPAGMNLGAEIRRVLEAEGANGIIKQEIEATAVWMIWKAPGSN